MPATNDHAASSITNDSHFAAALEAAKLEALYQFAYGLSHEINNPLANIATRAQTLLIDERDPDRRRKLATINQQAFRAHEMIADLMLFARPPAPRKEPTDLAALASRVVAEIEPLATEQGTSLVCKAGPSRREGPAPQDDADSFATCTDSPPFTALVDPTQIAVALRAIIQNSLEALGRGGSVEVVISDFRFQISDFESAPAASVLSTQYSVRHAAHADQSRVPPPHREQSENLKSEIRNLRLLVRDTGPGIPPHIRPHIFDPFFSGREAGRGLGLGLSKAWRIVTAHGGSIAVESPVSGSASDSGGAAFTIELPGE